MRVFACWLVLGLAVKFWPGGCAAPPEDHVKILSKVATWDSTRMMPALEGLTKEYEKTHSGIAVRILRIPYNEYLDRLTASQPASLLPDLLLVSTAQVAELTARNMLQPLKKPQPAQGFNPGLMKYFSFKERLYALPRDLAPVCLVYYNKDLFDRAHQPYPKDDEDWETFLQTAKTLTDTQGGKGRKRVWGFVDDWPMLEPWAYGQGGKWVNDVLHPVKYEARDKAWREALAFRDRMIRKEKICPSPGPGC